MNLIRPCLSALLLSLTTGCVVPIAEPVYSTCLGRSGGDWRAHLERAPRWRNDDKGKAVIVVSGKVNGPETIDVRLELGPVEKLDQRVQQILVRTEGGASADAPIVSHNVSARFDRAKRVESVRIRCGDGIFATIDPLAEAPPPAP